MDIYIYIHIYIYVYLRIYVDVEVSLGLHRGYDIVIMFGQARVQIGKYIVSIHACVYVHVGAILCLNGE